jgi:alanyl-tRNA synthetase
MIGERRDQAGAAKRIEERLALLEARALLREHDESRGAPIGDANAADARMVTAAVPEATAAYLGLLAGRLAAVNNVVALLVSRDSGHVVFAQSKGLSSDLGAALRESLKEFGGKGGGSRDFAQGSLPNPAEADAFLGRAAQLLKP